MSYAAVARGEGDFLGRVMLLPAAMLTLRKKTAVLARRRRIEHGDYTPVATQFPLRSRKQARASFDETDEGAALLEKPPRVRLRVSDLAAARERTNERTNARARACCCCCCCCGFGWLVGWLCCLMPFLTRRSIV